MSESVIDFRVDDQEIVKVDAIGTGAFIAMPHKEIGVLLDLEGMTNRPPSLEGREFPARARRHRRFVMTVGQAEELRDDLDRAIRDANREAV